ncbi:hypothetical protein A0E62_gp27 [Pyrobaculum filamentous virus 1]|uniref:Uncharacterized protein n=1 Tax=Pyrobaculum filamentous virus 1 TaxID=1805492 RepID=A0A140F3L3_PFV1|nr:hypothetical protein A0E62_gp27 [Pyrobaculum filamentous virus 1]AML61173.1 hypothetical protein [Pyrobaculum filamentous virus 1]
MPGYNDGGHKYIFVGVFISVIYRGRCWYTYDFVVTYKFFGTDRYVGYTGYKVCDPAVANPTVQISSDVGILYNKQAPDLSGYTDYYGEEVSVGNVDPSWVEFYIVEENFRFRSDPGDIPPQPGIDITWIGADSASASFGLSTSSSFGIDILYYWHNYSGSAIYVKGELYRSGTKICENSVQVNSGQSNVLLRLNCDTPGSDGEIRMYKSKWYVSVDGNTWYHVETKWNSVYYYAPGKVVGDIVFRPNPIIYGIENYTGKQYRNYGQAGVNYEYILMLCSMDPNTHQLVDDKGISLVSVENKCRWMTGTDTYTLGVKSRQLTLDGNAYKTVNVYGYGDGKVWSVQSKSGYNVYTINADNAVVVSMMGDYAFDFVNGSKDVDVSQAYQYKLLWLRGWGVKNLSEYFAGYIVDGSQYVSRYDRNYVTIYFDSAYSGSFIVEKDGQTVHSTNINVPAGGTYQYGPLSGGEWIVDLSWGSIASFKLLKSGISLTLTVQPL